MVVTLFCFDTQVEDVKSSVIRACSADFCCAACSCSVRERTKTFKRFCSAVLSAIIELARFNSSLMLSNCYIRNNTNRFVSSVPFPS